MPEPIILLYVAVEIALVLFLLAIYLLYHLTKKNKLCSKLETTIIDLRRTLAQSNSDSQPENQQAAEAQQYLVALDRQLDITADHYNSLKPGGNITLDPVRDAPIDRLACSLRHSYLLAEKEALYAGDEQQPDWHTLEEKTQQILDLYVAPSKDENNASLEVESSPFTNKEKDLLENKIAELQQNNLNLQTQYIELEERHLEITKPK